MNGLFYLIILLFLASFLMIGSELYKSDIEYGIERDIYNFTESEITIPYINISENHPIEKTKGIINQGRIYKIIDSGVNFLLVTGEQVVKAGVEFGYQNPNVDWKLITKLVVWLLVIIIIVTLIKPIGYVIIFIIMIVIMLIDKKKKRKNTFKHSKNNQKTTKNKEI